MMWFDLMAIPADAPNVDEAYQFLNYILRPEVIAAATNHVYYANANQAAFDQGLIEEEVTSDPAIYPDEQTLAKLYTTTPYSFETQEFVREIINPVLSLIIYVQRLKIKQVIVLLRLLNYTESFTDFYVGRVLRLF